MTPKEKKGFPTTLIIIAKRKVQPEVHVRTYMYLQRQGGGAYNIRIEGQNASMCTSTETVERSTVLLLYDFFFCAFRRVMS